MTLQQLRYLMAIAEHGSIGAAARSLFISQSSLSEALKEVETSAGTVLFDRSSRGVSLTKDGAEFLEHARRVLAEADALERRFSRDGARSRSLSVASQYLPFVSEAFFAFAGQSQNVGCACVLREESAAEVLESVASLRCDVGVLCRSSVSAHTFDALLERGRAVFKPLFSSKPYAQVPADHPIARRSHVSVIELSEYVRIAYAEGARNAVPLADEPLAQLGVGHRVEVGDRGLAYQALALLDGYQVVSGFSGYEHDGRLRCVPIDTRETMEVGCAVSATRPLSNDAKQFLAVLRATVESHLSSCAGL